MKTLLKIITLPIWLPFKILWFASKMVAFFVLVVLIAVAVYVAIHML